MMSFGYDDGASVWRRLPDITATESDWSDGLGSALDLDGDVLVAGAPLATDEFYQQGVVKVYDLAMNDCDRNRVHDTCEADFDFDGVIDACDNCTLFYNASQHDCDTNGVGDLCDMIYCPPDDRTCDDCNLNAVLDRCEPVAPFKQLAKFAPPGLSEFSSFGTRVLFDGNRLVVSAPNEPGERCGEGRDPRSSGAEVSTSYPEPAIASASPPPSRAAELRLAEPIESPWTPALPDPQLSTPK